MMTAKAVVSAIVPARDEEATVAQTVQALRGCPLVDEVVVVDDGSRDGTAVRAQQAGARVVRLSKNQGKAAALDAGVRETEGEVLLFVDADLGASATLTLLLVGPVLTGTVDMAIAHLLPGRSPGDNPGLASRPRRGAGLGLAVGLACRAIRELTGWEPQSPLSGQRALRRAVWEAVRPLPPGFGVEVALTIRSLERGFRLMEVPLPLVHRVTGWGISDIWHRARQWWQIRQAVEQCRREVGG